MRFVACALLALAAGCDTRVSLEGRSRACTVDGECALVFEGDVCHDTCALDHAISTAAVHAYDQEVERKQAACLSTYLSWWFQTDGDCFHAGVPACVDGTCEVAGTDGPPGPDAPPAPPPGQ